MPIALTVVPAVILAAVLIASGAAKLRTPDDVAGWEELGVPAVLRRHWLMRLHPIAELVLAAALLLLGGILGVLAAIMTFALFIVYLVMIWRVKKRVPDASCACFGERKPIIARTLLRNAWLVLLAATLTLGIGAAPLLGGVATWVPTAWPWLLALGAVAVTMMLVTDRAQPAVGQAPAEASPVTASDDELGDYVRTRTPSVPITLGDGTGANLRTLAAQQPRLLLAVSEGCTSCTPVIDAADVWQWLLPELGVHLLVSTTPAESPLTRAVTPQTLHDPNHYVRDSIDDWRTPSAVLLGADGLLAGGPVTGYRDIESFIGDVYESLHGVRPPV